MGKLEQEDAESREIRARLAYERLETTAIRR